MFTSYCYGCVFWNSLKFRPWTNHLLMKYRKLHRSCCHSYETKISNQPQKFDGNSTPPVHSAVANFKNAALGRYLINIIKEETSDVGSQTSEIGSSKLKRIMDLMKIFNASFNNVCSLKELLNGKFVLLYF